ncbi:LytR/AlgR family response regulator transcription factor [Zhouia sp. PK063]|uniref:LytR/AlgR family response regulator transcription factor n=1 Tax=Zhouia sp. PK063 TaxID=3373602 RepID=UPI0037A85B2E
MKCIIIDDEATARTIIRKLCDNFQDLEVVDEFEDAIQAIKFLNINDVDLILLDVHMPNFNGFDFVQTLKNPPKIVIISSDRNFALDAFEYESIVDYLIKPITQDRFQKALSKVTTALQTAIEHPEQEIKINKNEALSKNELYVNIDRRLVKINMQDVFLIEAKGDYINIKTTSKNYIVHSTLKKIEEKLPTDIFLKVHRSYIINIQKIIDIEDNSVLIAKDVVPVSRSNKPELIKRLNLL